MALRGKFITLEGPEGAGKITQAAMLKDALEARGIACMLTREPGGTALAEELRKLLKHWQSGDGEKMTPVTELLLMNAARSQHVRYKILPALEAGTWVLCDRFTDSTRTYQGCGRGMDRQLLEITNAAATAGCPPDRTLLFDLPVETGFARTGKRLSTAGNFDRFESEEAAFHQRIRAGYQEIARQEPERVRVIRADAAPDAVHQQVMEALRDLLR